MSDGSICFDPAPVHLGRGYGMRLQKALRRISLDEVMDEEFIIQDALPDQKRIRIHQRFNGDISGRYLGLYSQRLFAVQNDDGSFGYRIGTDVFFPKIYGNGRMLLGLTQYYRLTGDPRALRAAHGLVGYYRSIHDGALAHEDPRSQAFYFQALDGLVSLYALEPEEGLKRTINSIADAVWDKPQNHAHSYLTTLRALASWELIEPDASRRQWLFDRWQEAQAGATLDGSFTEVFPDKPRNEGCTIADWLGLHLRLWQLTDDDAMLDAAENIWLNALYTNQFENFGFGHRYYLRGERRLGYITEGTEAWWCCSYHGPVARKRAPGELLRGRATRVRPASHRYGDHLSRLGSYSIPGAGRFRRRGLAVHPASRFRRGEILGDAHRHTRRKHGAQRRHDCRP
jgi:hypothetical protein